MRGRLPVCFLCFLALSVPASLIVWFLSDVVGSKCKIVMAVCFMRFIFSSSSHGEDAAEAEQQPITAKDSKTHVVPPPSQPSAPSVKEEPEEPEGPSVEPATSFKVSSQPTAERTALSLEPLLPSKPKRALGPEPVLQPSKKPQQEGGDEAKPPDVMDGGRESFINNKEPVYEAEKQLWAAVEETTADTGAERGVENNEITEERDEKEHEEAGVIGG